MSQKVGIRVPVGNPAAAFLSNPPAAADPVPERQPDREPDVVAPPSRPAPPAPMAGNPAPAPTAGAAARRVPARPGSLVRDEPLVRFQFYLPASLAALVDAEVDRRKAAGRRGRGKSDYTAIFRELVGKHLR
jgi:hypothetical protein